MSLSTSKSYIIRGNVPCPLSIVGGSYGSAQMTLTINLGNHAYKGRLGTEIATADAGIFYPEAGIWKMIGTAANINAVLATLSYHGAIDATEHNDGQMPTLNASVVLTNPDTSVAETGTLTLTPDYAARQILTTPIAMSAPLADNQKYVQYTVDAPYVTLTLPEFTQGSVTNYVEKWTPRQKLVGKIMDADLERNAGRWHTDPAQPASALDDKYWRVYAPRVAINAFHQCIMFKPNTGETGSGYFDVEITDGYQAAATFQVGVYSVAADVTAPANFTVGEHAVTKLPAFTIAAPEFPFGPVYTASVVSSHQTTMTSGTGAGSWNASTKTYTVSGTLTEVKAALADLSIDKGTAVEDVASVAVNLTLNLTSPLGSDSATVVMTVTNEADAPVILNGSGTRAWVEDTQYAFSNLAIRDNDPGNTFTVTLVLSAAAGALATSGGTWNGTTRTMTITGTRSVVNSRLAAMVFNPAANYDADFTILTTVVDSTSRSSSATLTMDCTTDFDPLNVIVPIPTTFSQYSGSTQVFPTADVVTEYPAVPFTNLTLTLSDGSKGELRAPFPGAAYQHGPTAIRPGATVLEAELWLTQIKYRPNQITPPSLAAGSHTYNEDGTGNLTGFVITPGTYQDAAQTLTLDYSTANEAGSQTIDMNPSGSPAAEVKFTVPIAAGTLTGYAGMSSITSGANRIYSIAGTVAAINAGMSALTFTPVPNYDAAWSMPYSVQIVGETVDYDTPNPITGSIVWGVTTNEDTMAVTNLNTSINQTPPETTDFFLPVMVVTDPDSNANITVTVAVQDARGHVEQITNGSNTVNTGTGARQWVTTGSPTTVTNNLASLKVKLSGAGMGQNLTQSYTKASQGTNGILPVKPTIPTGSFNLTTTVTDGTHTVSSTRSMTQTRVRDVTVEINWGAMAFYYDAGFFNGAYGTNLQYASYGTRMIVTGPVAKVNDFLNYIGLKNNSLITETATIKAWAGKAWYPANSGAPNATYVVDTGWPILGEGIVSVTV